MLERVEKKKPTINHKKAGERKYRKFTEFACFSAGCHSKKKVSPLVNQAINLTLMSF